MADPFFLDTNVLVYTFDDTAPRKRDLARELTARALADGRGRISFQVVQEFLNVATRKFAVPLDEARAGEYLGTVLAPMCTVFASIPLYEHALRVQARWRLSWYDSLVVASAVESGAGILYSEDLQHGQRIESITVIDPFAADPDAPDA